jgi:hypothetical protein
MATEGGKVANEQEDAGRLRQCEETYWLVMATLEGLPDTHARALVVMNLVKYVMLKLSEELTPASVDTLMPVLKVLCADFAHQVSELPHTLARDLDLGPCGKCARCVAEATRGVN